MNLFKAAMPFYDAFTADPGTSDLDNEQPLTITVTLGDWRNLRRAMMLADTPAPEARAVNVEGRDFYELCQEYRHAPDYFDAKRGKTASQAFEALKSYITKGELKTMHKEWCDLKRPEYTGECTCSLHDGFGNIWEKCDHDDCALEIVRPGKVQCVLCQYGDDPPLGSAQPQNDTDPK